MQPLVSVLCLCYNHSSFINEAIESVMAQTYKNIEVFILDDSSTDNSWKQIVTLQKKYSSVTIIQNEENKGNCQSFNQLFKKSKGEFIIDFAADDVMKPNRIEEQVKAFQETNDKVGVIYSNAVLVDENGEELGLHDKTVKPEGDIYSALLEKYIVCPPTMMIKRKVLEELGGYDESLAYEDFDFWVRSSRKWHYKYLPEALTSKREVKNSLSHKFSDNKDKFKMQHSTYQVCLKAKELNQSVEEDKALVKRMKHELRYAFKTRNRKQVELYYTLLKEMKQIGLPEVFFLFFNFI